MKFLKLNLSEKVRILKNLAAFTTVFVLIFMPATSVTSIQSVLNQTLSLGITSQLVIFAVQILTCIAIPQVTQEMIGFKWILVISEICVASFVALNMYPRWYTLMPTSVLFGVSQSLLWTVVGLYITALSKQYSMLTEQLFNHVQAKFFGVFSAFYSSSYVFGSVLVGGILNTVESNRSIHFNITEFCGVNNCPTHKLPASKSIPSLASVYTLCGVFLSSCALALIVTVLFVDDLTPQNKNRSETLSCKSRLAHHFSHQFKALFKMFRNIDLYLLIPLTIYTGFEVTLVWNEFNRSFVTCVFNLKFIGWTSAVFGLTGIILAIFFSYITQYVTQQALIVLILMMSLGNGIFMISWAPSTSQLYVIFLLAASFGTTRAYYIGQIRGLYGTNFPSNPSSHSAATLFQSTGFIIGIIISLFFCTHIKLYVYLCISFVSLVCYLTMIGRQNSQDMKRVSKNTVEEMMTTDGITKL